LVDEALADAKGRDRLGLDDGLGGFRARLVLANEAGERDQKAKPGESCSTHIGCTRPFNWRARSVIRVRLDLRMIPNT